MTDQLPRLEPLEDRDVPAAITPAPVTLPQAAEPPPGSTEVAVPLPEANNAVEVEQAAVAAFPAGSGALAEAGVASSGVADAGFAAAVSPLAVFAPTGPTPESASAAPLVSTGFGPSAAPGVDRLLATARPRDELGGLGFRGRIVFPNTNMQDRSPTLPGPLDQPFGIFIRGGGSDEPQAHSEEASPAGRRVASAADAAVEVEPEEEVVVDQREEPVVDM
jgi:hypothetical protein